MRFITHNTLHSPIKGLSKSYPLGVQVREYVVREATFNPAFIAATLPSLDWEGLLVAAASVGLGGFPPQFDPALLADPAFLKAAHTLLLEIHVEDGCLVCPESGRQYPIVNGIPDMRYIVHFLLHLVMSICPCLVCM